MFSWKLVAGLAVFHFAFAQEPQELRLPHTSGSNSARVADLASDPASGYSSRREAALAALQAGYKAATVEQNRGRAMWYLLVSLRRDHFIGKTLYDMGVLCAQDERWRDALSFYRAAQQANAEPQIAQLAAAEIERVQAIELMESTPVGKKQRLFEIQLMAAIRKGGDPSAALVESRSLAKQDKTRWEPLALMGIMHAKNGTFVDSAKELEDAARLAPLTQRQKLQSAANVARREASFTEQVRRADGLWEKKQYDLAAREYAEAFQNSPEHLDVGAEAATSFLLADQVGPAVEVLAKLRDARSDDLSAKAVAMLKELGSISADARREAAQARVPSANKQPSDAAWRIANLVGPLATRQMELTAKPDPPLLSDSTPFIPVHDEELTGGRTYTDLLSTDSVFDRYRLFLAEGSGPSLAEPAPASTGAAVPVGRARSAEPTERQSFPLATPAEASPATAHSGAARASAAPGQPLSVTSNPPGALVAFDDTASLNCTTPCRIPLAPGRHTLRATLPGYREILKIFNVDKKTGPVEITLQAKGGVLYVQNDTPGADIFLNGKKTDRRTPAQFSLTEGDYEVGIQVAGREVVAKKVAIKDGALVRADF